MAIVEFASGSKRKGNKQKPETMSIANQIRVDPFGQGYLRSGLRGYIPSDYGLLTAMDELLRMTVIQLFKRINLWSIEVGFEFVLFWAR